MSLLYRGATTSRLLLASPSRQLTRLVSNPLPQLSIVPRLGLTPKSREYSTAPIENAESKPKTKRTTTKTNAKPKASAIKTKAKEKKANPITQLKQSIAKEKTKLQELKKQLLIKEKEVNAAIKERKANAKKSELQQKLIKKAIKNPRKWSVNNFYSRSNNVLATLAHSEVQKLSKEEFAKWNEATDKFNEQYLSLFTSKPELGPINALNKYVAENFHSMDTTLPVSERFGILVKEYAGLSQEEKQKYKIDPEEKKKIDTLRKEWIEKRLKEYDEAIRFKKEYKYGIDE